MENAINNNLRTNANTFKYNIQVYIYNKYIIHYILFLIFFSYLIIPTVQISMNRSTFNSSKFILYFNQ